MSTGQYLLAFLLLSIPGLGQLLLLIWSFSSSTNVNKRNLCRAILITGFLTGILLVLLMIAASRGLVTMRDIPALR